MNDRQNKSDLDIDDLKDTFVNLYNLSKNCRKCVEKIKESLETLGYYSYMPYYRSLWTNYMPPMYRGEVIKRYHEITDQTFPNSIGVNIIYFDINEYSIIPTLYHEYWHYKGDKNESSVWLKTHLFSKKFIKNILNT
jgi:NADH:ubiquinone oxidoreductase subunit